MATQLGQKRTVTDQSRWVVWLIFIAATAHVLMGVASTSAIWADILSEGLWNTVAIDDDARMAALWFLLTGIGLYGLGFLTRGYMSATGKMPKETGWTLLAMGIPMTLLEPVSGGWVLLMIGVLALLRLADTAASCSRIFRAKSGETRESAGR